MNLQHIPGYTGEEHLNRLGNLVSTLKPNSRILEIGCAYGRSTWCILNHITPGTTVDTVDTFAHLKTSKMYKSNHKGHKRMGIKMHKTFAHNLEQMMKLGHRGFYDWLIQQHPHHEQHCAYQMTSVEYMKLYAERTYDLVYLDGDHAYETVSKELQHYKNTDILCGDDWGPVHPQVTQAVDEFRSQCVDRVWTPPGPHPRTGYPQGFWSLTKTA